MKGKKVVLTLMAVALLVVPTAVTASAAGPGDPDTTITITDATLECGSTATSQILVTIVNQENDPKEVRGVEAHLSFDPALVEVVSVTPSAALFDGTLQIGQNQFDNGAGTIDFAVAQSDGTPVFNATDAAIATITWQCAGECPEAQVETEVTVEGNTLMSDPEGYRVDVDCAVSGIITIPACVTGGCIEGYVSPQGRYDFSGVHVVADAHEADTDASGYFKLEGLEAGTYDVTAEMYGYLDAAASSVQVVVEGCTDLGATKLLGGEVVVPDQISPVIDISDITYIASRFRGADMTADVNGDSMVNILDLTMAAANFERTGPTPWAE